MRALEVSSELGAAFEAFRHSSASGRKSMLPEIQRLCNAARGAGHSYISEKCSKLYESCKNMARLRQPSGYDESREISFALGDLSMIQNLLRESSEKRS